MRSEGMAQSAVRIYRTALKKAGHYNPSREWEIYQTYYNNPAFQDVDGLTNQVTGSTYGSYQTLTNENYPTRSVSTISPVSKSDYPAGRANPGFLTDNPDSGPHVYPERPLNGLYATKSLPRPEIKTPSHTGRRSYSPTEDRELPTYYMPVNSHRKLLRGEILYVTKDTRNSGTKCWKRALCIGLIAAILVVAIVIGSLSGAGIIFSRNQNGDVVQTNPSSLSGSEGRITKDGVDIEVHELDGSAGQVSPSRLDPSGKDISREPKSDQTLTEFRRQHPGEVVSSTQRPGMVTSRHSAAGAGPKTQAALITVDDQSSFNDGVPEAVEGVLRIMNMDFQAALSDRNSWIFQYTSNDLAVYLNEIFMKATNSINYNATRVVSFRQGSVIVKYQALWNQASEKWENVVLNVLNRHLDANNNFIGNYLVDRASVSVKSIFYTCRINNGGCSHLCEFDLLEMRHYCLCPDNTYSLINLTTCVISRPSVSSITRSILAVSDTTTTRTTLGSTAALITKQPSTETPTTTVSSTATTISTSTARAVVVPAETTTSLKSGSLTSSSGTTVAGVVSTAPPTVHIQTVPATHHTTASSADHVGLLIIQKDLNHELSNASVISVVNVVSPTSSSPSDHMDTLRRNTTNQMLILHSELPTSAAVSTWESLLNVTATTPTHWTMTSSTVVPPSMATESGAIHSATGMVVAEHHAPSAVANVTQLMFSAATVESHHTESPSSSVMPGVLDMNHVDSTFFGHVLIPFGNAAKHEGATTEDDLDHHEDGEHSTTSRPVRVESDFLLTNRTEHDVLDHSVPLETAGGPALLILRKMTTQQPSLSVSCPAGQILCAGDGRCVPALAQCNGVPECSDGSDEKNCTDCQQNFRCLAGNCIPVGLVCDGIEDCSDGSDEFKCSQSFCQAAGMFQCVSGYCLENSSRCDGLGDCYAMGLPVDEMNCFGPQISNLCADAGHFMCSQSRRCIPMNWRCNGRTDCLNNEDEKGCTCDPATTFACDGGGCIDNLYRCNGVAECPDGYSDERDCLRLQPTGMLEVQYMNNEWRTVCSDNWNLRSASAVCRQLGYRPAMSIFSLEAPTGNNSNNVFWMDPDVRNAQPLQSRLRGTTSAKCLTNSTRAGVMCERFRCQSGWDPDTANPSKLLSAIVKISFDNDTFVICNGYLVAPMWVVTAASCLANRNASGMKLSFYMDAFRTEVTEVAVHPLYLPVRMLHDRDFALIKLAQTVPSNFLPLCLPTDYTPLLCKLVKLNGSRALTPSRIEPVNTTACNSKSNFSGLVTGSMECWSSSQSICDDDAVSPTICQTILGNWEFRGFLSYHHHCSLFSKKPLVMANLSYAASWIRSVVGPSLSNVIQTTEPPVFVPYVEAALAQGAPQAGIISNDTASNPVVHEILLPESPTVTAHPDSHGLHGDADSLAELNINIQSANASISGPFFNVTGQNLTFLDLNSTFSPVGSPSFNVSSTSVTVVVGDLDPARLTCPDGTLLLLDFLCDGIFQCPDGWDEKMEICMKTSCSLPGHQRCANGRCVDSIAVCDGRSQCPLINTDEVGCKDCDKTTHFKCLEGRCIPSSWMCDGEKDCMYGEDETGDRCALCQNATESFRCTYGGGCVANSKVCDGVLDCPDSSDESSCVRLLWTNESSSTGLVNIRSHGSDWAPVCRSGIGGKEAKQWADTVCHELGFDFSNTSEASVFSGATFAILNEIPTDSNVYLALKNMTTLCNKSEVLTAACGFIQRGDWKRNVTDLDLAVAYKIPQDEYRHIVLLIHVKGGLEPCVGTLLSSRWILTSHECISEADSSLSPFDWIVSTDPNSVDDNSLRFIRRFVTHPSVKFNVYFSRHDLVLVELMDGVDLTSGANKVAWPARHPMTVKSTCVTYGWLYSSVEIPGTRIQRKSQGQLFSWRTSLMMNEQCNQASFYNGLVDGAMFCGGFRNNTHRSPCMGRVDGAPVMCLNAENVWEISGVRSYQPPCDSSWLAPSVYTDLYQHRRWIGDVVGAQLTAV